MKQAPLLILMSFLIPSVISCSNKDKKETQEVDIAWNDKVQDTFFGLKLGDSISYHDVITTLYNKGFIQSEYSNDTYIIFAPRDRKTFSFGGLSWEWFNIGMKNGVFRKISFCNANSDKASALENYNDIRDAVSSKYRLTELNPKDTTTYAITRVAGKNNVSAYISCFRYESVAMKILIGTSLEYYYTYKDDTVNAEL